MRILVCSNDQLGKRMAGPAIRAVEIVKYLAATTDHSISLIGPGEEEITLPPGTDRYRNGSFFSMCKQLLTHDIIISPSLKVSQLLVLFFSRKTFILDSYDPVPLEILEQHSQAPLRKKNFLQYFHTSVLKLHLKRADVVLCASERQRAWYLGLLTSVGRITPQTYTTDPKLEHMISIAPFGLQEDPPKHTQQVLKGVVKGIEEDDTVIIWGGGIWNWFDPLSLIQAIAEVIKTRPQVKLFFLGVQHPNPAVPYMRRCTEAIDLAKQLGLWNTHVFFNQGWTPFEERQNYLLESDIAVSTHFDHLETEFSFRTRLLDYVWAALPMIATQGDVWSEIISQNELGFVVKPKDVPSITQAILRLVDDEQLYKQMRQNIETLRPKYTWKCALRPLQDTIKKPPVGGHHLNIRNRLSASVLILVLMMRSFIHIHYFKT